ncbi:MULTISPECIES: RHS repeat-associated core domain-containing protein [unclassified Brenneria]|uniref:RHS repeat-associated core domain-containing protein n=1 Tax=unclassified Brenneria TaxID=2634434 RepID=UPI0029C17932|nr:MULTISPECIES: RHS repeat-associated core domain-containing protein [unclassified Brenneria]MDX5631167.1 RHS repeat-associated core domain-containing protein [Brenneria sp. L3-3Z]MDX5698235.1 RHS repeat-associated core domain-containing protein [Brenneria sp. L4-2C]
MTAYSYDAFGQLTHQTDAAGRLTTLMRTPTAVGIELGIEADTVRLQYDRASNLVSEQGVNGELGYQWDALSNLQALTLPQGDRLQWLYYGSGHAIAMKFNQQMVSEFTRDRLHRETGRTQGALHQQLRYAGQYADSETGLHYNLFRYFDPVVGRFTTQDPVGLRGGLNLYAYVKNPLTWIDPLGLTPCKGLPSTRKAGGTGKNYDPVNGQGLYVLHDGKSILYVGRGDAPSRLNIHANTPGKSHLDQLTIFDNNLTKAEAKFLEQRIMDLHGGAKSTDPLTNLLNKISSYSPNNPNAVTYDIAGHSHDWGSKELNDIIYIFKGNGL